MSVEIYAHKQILQVLNSGPFLRVLLEKDQPPPVKYVNNAIENIYKHVLCMQCFYNTSTI